MDELDELLAAQASYYASETKIWEKDLENEGVSGTDWGSEEEEDFEPSDWDKLPDLALEKIFSYLNLTEKYNASLVCKHWYQAFYFPASWATFKFEDTTLTRRRFNYYSGWQGQHTDGCIHFMGTIQTVAYLWGAAYKQLHTLQELLHYAQSDLTCSKGNIKHIIFVPMTNFYNLYEFMNMISFYAEQEELGTKEFAMRGVGSNIETLSYTFPCNQAYRNQAMLYGTGGKLLAAVKRLMGNLHSLRCLQLVDLMLDAEEAVHLLDQVCYSHCLTLHSLTLVNVTRFECPLLHIGVFLNLQVLAISPQNLSEDALYLLSEIKTLAHLHIVQNRYTSQELRAIPWKAWNQCKKKSPNLQVHLQVESNHEKGLLWQENAPVASIWYDSPEIKVSPDSISTAIELYGPTLRFFGHTHLPKYFQSKSFRDRIDPFYLFLANKCPNLNTLIIRERISTATVLLLASHGKQLKQLYIRRNAVILRNDWPRNPEWPNDFSTWLKKSCRSYEVTEREVSQILGFRWQMLSDKEFKRISPNLHCL